MTLERCETPDRDTTAPHRRDRPPVRPGLPGLRRARHGPALVHLARRRAAVRGPEPRPDWVVTSRGRRHRPRHPQDGQGGRRLPARASRPRRAGGVVMAAKRYRDTEHRNFHRSRAYAEGRRTKRSRDARRSSASARWGAASPPASGPSRSGPRSVRLWERGCPVPYPVQIDGTEILMEWITPTGDRAPARPDPARARRCSRPTTSSSATRCDAGPHGVVARRPVAVQHPGGGRAPGDHRPAPGGRPGRRTRRGWTSCCATAPTSARGSGAGARGRRAGPVRRACWPRPSEPRRRGLLVRG